MRMGVRALGLAMALPAVASAAEPAPAGVQAAAPVQRRGDFRLKRVTVSVPQLRVDAPQSPLRTGFGGSMVDLFPVTGAKLHVSAGGRLFGRAGRPRAIDPEATPVLPPFRSGAMRGGRRFSPAMLVGYGRTVDRGLAFGVDAGVVMGKLGVAPDRLRVRRFNVTDGHGGRSPINEIARVTALYRF